MLLCHAAAMLGWKKGMFLHADSRWGSCPTLLYEELRHLSIESVVKNYFSQKN
jgi:hypothetical protein